jgi:glutamate synthase (ferredoxin)
MAALGFRTFDEMVGRASEVLEQSGAADHWKARHLDLSAILHRPEISEGHGHCFQRAQDHELENTLDKTKLLDICRPALEAGERVVAELEIRNTDRAVGTLLGSEISRRFGAKGLPDDTIRLAFRGSAGQSFGAFVPRGMTMAIEGDANDYVGKGLSGGNLIVYPPRTAVFPAHENVIVGNTVLYGATNGSAFIAGLAGERFAVRNSGAVAVVEGVGDHGCEYMTGGRVIILGQTGKNFGAGMSGGIAYVFDQNEQFHDLCNRTMVNLMPLEQMDEADFVRDLIAQHFEYTGSARAEGILRNWRESSGKFVRVIPVEYQRVVEAQKQIQVRPPDIEIAAIAA